MNKFKTKKINYFGKNAYLYKFGEFINILMPKNILAHKEIKENVWNGLMNIMKK